MFTEERKTWLMFQTSEFSLKYWWWRAAIYSKRTLLLYLYFFTLFSQLIFNITFWSYIRWSKTLPYRFYATLLRLPILLTCIGSQSHHHSSLFSSFFSSNPLPLNIMHPDLQSSNILCCYNLASYSSIVVYVSATMVLSSGNLFQNQFIHHQ